MPKILENFTGLTPPILTFKFTRSAKNTVKIPFGKEKIIIKINRFVCNKINAKFMSSFYPVSKKL
jgi:hypothetical protein